MALFHRLGQPCCRRACAISYGGLAHMVASFSSAAYRQYRSAGLARRTAAPGHRFDRFWAAYDCLTAQRIDWRLPTHLCPSTGALPRPPAAPMAAQELEADQAVASVAGTTGEDLASQATAPSHVLDSESLLSQPSVIVEAEPEAEPDEADDVFGDFETSDAPYVIPAFQEKTEPIQDADKKKWKSYNAQRKKEKKDLIPFEVWLANKKDQEERKKKAKFVAMMGGTISASRLVSISP